METEKPILVISKKTSNRGTLLRSLDAVKMKYEVLDELSEFHAVRERTDAAVVVHVLEDFERGEVGLFHHRLVRSELGRRLARFLVYRGSNERAVCFASDLGMQKAIQAEHALSTLGYTLQLAMKAHADLEPELREALEISSPGDCCTSPERLEELRAIAKKYPLIENLVIVAAYAGLILEGDAEGAIRKGQAILSRSSRNIRAMTLVGEALLQVKEYEAAAKMLMNAESFAAGNPTRLALIGRIAAHVGNVDSAKKCLIKSVEICPVIRVIKPLIAMLTLTQDEMSSLKDLLALRLSPNEIDFIFEK